MPTATTTSWADDSEESDFIVKDSTQPSEKDGFKYVTEYITRDNKKYKVTKKIRLVKKANKKVQERKKWKPFGIATSSVLDDGSTISTTVSEPVYFEKVGETALETVQSKETQLLDKLQSQLLSGTFSAAASTQQTTSKAYRPPSASEEQGKTAGAYKPPQQKAETDVLSALGGKGKYVPPSQRGAAAAAAFGRGHEARGDEDKRIIRVSNLGEDVSDRDLKILFSKCGPIERCYLVTDRVSRASKGFAFITFEDVRSAEKAIAQFNGQPLDHLIISVEYAKPPKSF
jgi:translation initiation factor 3 subunit G